MREREGRELEHPCRLARVKDADEVEAKVPLEPEHVRIAPVQHLGDARVGEDVVERVERAPQLERVDQVVLLAGRDLHQADEAAVGAVGVRLEVDGDLARGGEPLAHPTQPLLRVNPVAGRVLQRGVEPLRRRRRELRLVRLEVRQLVLVRIRVVRRRPPPPAAAAAAARLVVLLLWRGEDELEGDEGVRLGAQLREEGLVRVVHLPPPPHLRPRCRAGRHRARRRRPARRRLLLRRGGGGCGAGEGAAAAAPRPRRVNHRVVLQPSRRVQVRVHPLEEPVREADD
mmetsp:Transcript_37442/g.121203  ORF Transcript_37442/g.121203 Transcript_37442/m.121203 type:complete len:286 (-) Transcript_37442:343-1200(-)